jgi:hypothetical protein
VQRDADMFTGRERDVRPLSSSSVVIEELRLGVCIYSVRFRFFVHTGMYWATRPCAVSVEECSVGRRTGNAGLEMKNI